MWLGYSWCRHLSASAAKRAAAPASSEVGLGGGAATASSGPRTRSAEMALAAAGRLAEVLDAALPRLLHHARRDDAALRQVMAAMAQEVGAEGFIRQQKATMERSDSRPMLARIRAPTLVLVGEGD